MCQLTLPPEYGLEVRDPKSIGGQNCLIRQTWAVTGCVVVQFFKIFFGEGSLKSFLFSTIIIKILTLDKARI